MYSAKTLCYSELCYISISFFKHLLHNNASFAYQVLINISEESLQMHKQMQANYELHLPGKIAKALLYFSESIYDSSNFNLPFSKSEFANYIGASRERVSKILNQFTYDKIIEMQGRQIKINNMNLLQKLSKIG
jgi:CRP/FNR family transcriptional regulator